MDKTTEKFESWAKVELFGHQVIVGKVTEATIGGGNFIRVDVPADGDRAAYTKFYGPAAIYAMTPVSEEVATLLMRRHYAPAINRYELPAAAVAVTEDQDGDDNDDQEFED